MPRSKNTEAAEAQAAAESHEDAPDEPEQTGSPDSAAEGEAGSEATVERPHEPTDDEQDAEIDEPEEVSAEELAEQADALEELETGELEDLARAQAAAAAEQALQEIPEDEVPTLSTDHEFAAYTSGYRAGVDDPGWLLTLAELRRHLGSFFTEPEVAAFESLSPDDFWSRWTIGYMDALAGRASRVAGPRTPDEYDW